MGDFCRKLFYCCGGRSTSHHHAKELLLISCRSGILADTLLQSPGRSKVDYDNVLADSEREAVADLLNYLENVRTRDIDTNQKEQAMRPQIPSMLTTAFTESRDRFLLWGATERAQHPRLQPEHRPTT